MSSTLPETRRRHIQTTAPTIPNQLKELAKRFFFRNVDANAASKEAKEARAELLGAMKNDGITQFNFQATLPSGATTTLGVELNTPSRDLVDPHKLANLVGMEKLLEIASIPKEKAEALFGKSVVAQCLTTVAGEENVNVKQAK